MMILIIMILIIMILIIMIIIATTTINFIVTSSITSTIGSPITIDSFSFISPSDSLNDALKLFDDIIVDDFDDNDVDVGVNDDNNDVIGEKNVTKYDKKDVSILLLLYSVFAIIDTNMSININNCKDNIFLLI